MVLSVRTAITAPQSRLRSHSVPEIINNCFLCQDIFDPLKHTHTKTNTLILDRFWTRFIHLQPSDIRPLWGQTVSLRRGQRAVSMKTLDCFTKILLKLFWAFTFVPFGMNSTSMSVTSPFFFCFFFLSVCISASVCTDLILIFFCKTAIYTYTSLLYIYILYIYL